MCVWPILEWFSVSNGVQQGAVLSHILFAVCVTNTMDWLSQCYVVRQ